MSPRPKPKHNGEKAAARKECKRWEAEDRNSRTPNHKRRKNRPKNWRGK